MHFDCFFDNWRNNLTCKLFSEKKNIKIIFRDFNAKIIFNLVCLVRRRVNGMEVNMKEPHICDSSRNKYNCITLCSAYHAQKNYIFGF